MQPFDERDRPLSDPITDLTRDEVHQKLDEFMDDPEIARIDIWPKGTEFHPDAPKNRHERRRAAKLARMAK